MFLQNLHIQYFKFFQGINISSLANSVTSQILNKHNIILLDRGGLFNINQQSYKSPKISIKYTQQQGDIVHYQVIIAKFKLLITLINFDRQAPQYNKDNQRGSGNFATVRLEKSRKKSFIVKRQPFKKISKSTQLQKQWNMNANRQGIERVIVEYCFYKICSLYKIGPAVNTDIGFDLVCYKNSIQFHLQYCNKIQLRKQFNYEQFEKQMKQNLKLMHEFKLIHKDVKPTNMLYSHQYKRYVLTDFGISHSIQQNFGEKTQTQCAGSPHYMGKSMKQLYNSIKKGSVDISKQMKQIDLYNNDFEELKQALKQILRNLLNKQESNQRQEQFLRQQKKKIEIEKEKKKKKKSNQKWILKYRQQIEQKLQKEDKSINIDQKLEQDMCDVKSPPQQQYLNIVQSKPNQFKPQPQQQKSYEYYKHQYYQLFKQTKIQNQQYSREAQQILQKMTSFSPEYYQFLKLKYISIKNNLSFKNSAQSLEFVSRKQIYMQDILNTVLESSNSIKKKQIYQIMKDTTDHKYKSILQKIKVMIDHQEITKFKPNSDRATTLKLRNYLRIYGQDIQTIKLCKQLLLENSNKKKYQQLLTNIKYIYNQKLKIISQIDYTQGNKMIVKQLNRKLAKLETEKNKDKQILQVSLQLLEYVEEYEKQMYLIKISLLSAERNELEQLIYQIENLFTNRRINNNLEQKYNQIFIAIQQVSEYQKKQFLFKKLIKRLYDNHKYKKALHLGEYLLQIYQKQQGKQNLKTPYLYHQISLIYSGMKNYQSAKKYSQKCISNQKKFYGQQHPDIAVSYHQLSVISRKIYKFQQALDYVKKSIQIKKKYDGNQHPSIAVLYHQLSLIYRSMNKYQQSLINIEYSIQIKKKFYKQQNLAVTVAYHQVSMIYKKMGKFQQALDYAKKSLQIKKKYYGQQHLQIAVSYHQLSLIYWTIKNYQQAHKYIENSIQIKKKQYNQENIGIAASYHQASVIYKDMGKCQQALDYAKKSLEIKKKYCSQYHLDIALSYHLLSIIYYNMSRYQQSLQCSQIVKKQIKHIYDIKNVISI